MQTKTIPQTKRGPCKRVSFIMHVRVSRRCCLHSVYNSNNDDSNGDNWDLSGLFPDIRIWRNVKGRERDSDEIFSTAVHEIAHGPHIQLMNGGEIQFLQVEEIIYESWAVAVQWHITSLTYKELGISNYGNADYDNQVNGFRLNFGYQNWRTRYGQNDNSAKYTPLFIDLVDNIDQSQMITGEIVDRVSGFSLVQIESNMLKHVYGLQSLREQLVAHNQGPASADEIILLLNEISRK